MTTGQSAGLALRGEVERGIRHTEPKAPPNGGGEGPAFGPELSTTGQSAGLALRGEAGRRPWLAVPSARACVPLVLALLGLAAVIDGLRIKYTVREPGLFDPLGPDHYVIGIGSLLILLALALAWQHRAAGESAEPLVGRRVGRLAALCVAYPVLIGLGGFTMATIVFVTVAARAMGATSWWAALRIALACALVLFLVFDLLADIQFPVPWVVSLWEGWQP